MSTLPWNGSPSSDVRLNKMTIPVLTGAEISALNKSLHRLVVCRQTGSGFTIDHVYLANTAADTWIDVFTGLAAGGSDESSLVELHFDNTLFSDLFMNKTDDLKKAQWIETTSNGGSIEDATDGTTGERSIRLRTNTTSGGAATISYPEVSLDWSKRAIFEAKVRIETASSLAYHGGVGADTVTDADSNTRKIQAEICTATNNNWHLGTANGSSNSRSDTGVAISTSRTWYQIYHQPDLGTPQTDMYIDDSTVFQKTSNIPTSSSTAHINLLKHSIKNSTTSDRPIHIYPTRLRYMMTDKWA